VESSKTALDTKNGADAIQDGADAWTHERRGFGFGGFRPPSSGNRAFDEYRVETLSASEEEQTEFPGFPRSLRHAKDKEEFDQFMAQHKQRRRRERSAAG